MKQTGPAASWSCELLTPGLWHAKSLSGGNAARRRVWRIVGVGMGLPRHDREVEVLMSDSRSSMQPLVPFASQRLPRVLNDLK